MRTGYILVNGNLSTLPKLSNLIKKNDLLICADGAAEHAFKQNLIPDIIIGDLDSITTNVRNAYIEKNVEFITYPREKDFTDTELAISYAVKNHAQNLVICGLLGDRVDHMLSNILHLSEVSKNVPCKLIEADTTMYFVSNSITIKGNKNDELSLIPLTATCKSVATQGLYYPLLSEDLYFGTTRGISNIYEKKKVIISLKEGRLLVIHKNKFKLKNTTI